MKIIFRSPHRVTLIPLTVIGLSLTAMVDEGWLVNFAKVKAQSAKEGKPSSWSLPDQTGVHLARRCIRTY